MSLFTFLCLLVGVKREQSCSKVVHATNKGKKVLLFFERYLHVSF